MLYAARFVPAVLGLGVIALLLNGPSEPAANLCRIARHSAALRDACLSIPHLGALAGAVAISAIAVTLLSLRHWQGGRGRVISYESDAGRWVMIGWVLAVGGAVSLLLGLMLIGSGGWPFSEQSRHIQIRTGQLPLQISTVQRRYLAQLAARDGTPGAVCISFGEVTIANRSRHRALALDLSLRVSPRDGGAGVVCGLPGRGDLATIARRGQNPQALFGNPIELLPRTLQRRELVFVVDPAQATPMADDVLSLEVRDRLSGQAIGMTLPAEYRG